MEIKVNLWNISVEERYKVSKELEGKKFKNLDFIPLKIIVFFIFLATLEIVYLNNFYVYDPIILKFGKCKQLQSIYLYTKAEQYACNTSLNNRKLKICTQVKHGNYFFFNKVYLRVVNMK